MLSAGSTTRAPELLLPLSPLPSISSTLLSAVHDDEDVLDPPLGVSGHVPLPTTDRFGFCFLRMKFFNLNLDFVGISVSLIALLAS